MKKYINENKKGLILVLIGFITLCLLITNHEINQEKMPVYLEYDLKFAMHYNELSEEEKLNEALCEHNEMLKFYAKTFQIDFDTLKSKIKDNYKKLQLDQTDKWDKIIIDYLLELEKEESNLFQKSITPCTSSKEYMLNLINYFSNIYGNVDYDIAASIAYIESGYRAPTMLKKNNIFGGMANGKLISYKNIEYGILRYIRLLSEGYFAKGLTTVEKIGKVYNPVYANGVKKANVTWVSNVKKMQKEFQDYETITEITEIL